MPKENLSLLTFDTRDEFQRKTTAEKAISLLLADVAVSPMVIDGKWGTGKTEFCHKLINLLRETKNEVNCAYVDAFKADYAGNPLITLIAAIASVIDEETEQTTFINKAIPAVRYGLKTVGKAGVAWLLKQSAEEIADEFEDAVKQAGEDSINVAVESLIKEHQDAEKNLDALRNALIQIGNDNPIVVFIDELDRCKPDFAVSILEHIKHVFDVDNVQFVLVANFDQLKNSIDHCYGLGVDAQRYLDKFVKFSFNLSPLFSTDNYNFTPVSVTHAKNLIAQHPELSKSDLLVEGYQSLIETLITENNLSLREVETYVRYIEIYNVLNDNNAFPKNLIFGFGLLRLLAIYYFCFHKDICDQLDQSIIDGPKMSSILGIRSHTKFSDVGFQEFNLAIATLIFLESTTPVDGLDKSDNEDITAWNASIHSLFRGGTFPPGREERVVVITRAIRSLRMTN